MTTSRLLLAALLASAPLAPAAGQESRSIKFATLAPEGSTWMKVMTDFSAELEKETGGRLKFKFYPGGVAGDEKDVVKKIRIGQLQAGGFTGVGLGEIAPETRLLDAPWFFRGRRELDHVRGALNGELEAALERGGFVCLGWLDLGSVYIFSRSPIRDVADMRRARMWVWEGDPIAQAAYQALGVSPVPLSVVDVMQALETGMVDSVYGPPLGVLALQWFQRLKSIYPVPMAESTGAVLISKRFFDSLPEDQRKILVRLAEKNLRRLNELTNADNARALEALQKQGLALEPMPGPETLRRYEALGRAARRGLIGRLYDRALLARAEKDLADFRAKRPAKG